MGYYSNVAIVIRGKAEFMLTQIASLKLTGDEHTAEALKEFCVTRDGQDLVVMAINQADVKWYDRYPDVQAFNAIFRHFEEFACAAEAHALDATLASETHALDGAFVRVGEDIKDIEETYFGNNAEDLARVYRGVECEYPTDKRKDIRHNLTSLEEEKKTT